MSEVELLREAAKTMRERAEAATPGPWEADQSEIYGNPRARWVAETLKLDNDEQTSADAAYVASWHPAVALAVADLLDRTAWMGGLDPDLLYRIPCERVIAVARAYLGSGS